MTKEKNENVIVRTFNKIKRISNVIDIIVQLGYIAYLILCIYFAPKGFSAIVLNSVLVFFT